MDVFDRLFPAGGFVFDLNVVEILTAAVKILVVILAAWIVLRYGVKMLERFLLVQPTNGDERRRLTMGTLIRSLLKYGVYFLAGFSIVLIVMPEAGTALLAGTGILGLAVGFGAQSLVRDVITGFFIIFEDQYAVGDYVTVAGASGVVEEIGLRVTKLRDFSGELHVIPNGLVEKSTNHSRGNMRVWLEIGIAYEEDVDEAISVMQHVCDQAAAEIETIVEGPTVMGVQELADSAVVIAVWARTQPMEQWAVSRELRRRIKVALDAAGIEIPYPRRVVVPAASTKIGVSKNPEDETGGAGGGQVPDR